MFLTVLFCSDDVWNIVLIILGCSNYPSWTGWNMLYFLWGVFRGKKVNCLQDASGIPKKYCMPGDLPATIISLPETMRSLGPTDGDLRTCSKVYYVALGSECPASMESPCLSSETINEDCDTSKSCLDPKGQCPQANARQQDCNLDATPLPSIQRTSAMSFQETRCTCAPLVMLYFSYMT